LDEISKYLEDETIFPSDKNIPFPKNSLKTLKLIFKKIFRIYCHLIKDHWVDIEKKGFDAHISTSFKHFTLVILFF
jgi:MOB kinase activator 1